MRGQCLCAELGAGHEGQEQPGEQCRRSSGAHVRADGRAVSERNDPPFHGGELGGRPCVEITWLAEKARGLTQEERDVVRSHMTELEAQLHLGAQILGRLSSDFKCWTATTAATWEELFRVCLQERPRS